jgi:hypothetical protein
MGAGSWLAPIKPLSHLSFGPSLADTHSLAQFSIKPLKLAKPYPLTRIIHDPDGQLIKLAPYGRA